MSNTQTMNPKHVIQRLEQNLRRAQSNLNRVPLNSVQGEVLRRRVVEASNTLRATTVSFGRRGLL